MTKDIPVITIDGPSGTGKGTLASLLADHLQWHMLDSGALYRALAWAVLERSVDPSDEVSLKNMLDDVELELIAESPTEAPKIICDGQNINDQIREEAVGNMASKIAAIPLIRDHLMRYQRMMRQAPGLIADGRDMGSVVFPDANVKFYLEASPEVRAKRRYNQLKEKGISVSLPSIREDLDSRDYRDEHRSISPMKAESDMIRIDTSDLDIEQVLERVLGELRKQLQSIN